MQEAIELSRGSIAPDATITIHLIRRPGRPELIALHWPNQPTPLEPSRLPAATTAVIAAFAEACIQLAAIRAAGR